MRMIAAVGLLLALSACGRGSDDTVAVDPTQPAPPTQPTGVPAAPGTVHTSGLVMVMDTGTPEVCLGPVAESFPPQCTGPELVGWDWADHRPMFERQGDVRWGQFALTGTWDGSRLTVSSAVPAALYDVAAVASPAYPVPEQKHTAAELADIAEDLADLPGAQGAGEIHGQNVVAPVTYDDGSLQAWATDTWGEGTVVVTSLLVEDQ